MGRLHFFASSIVAFAGIAAAQAWLYSAAAAPWSLEDPIGTAMLGPFGMMLLRKTVSEEFPLALPFFYVVFRITVKRLRDLEWDEILAWLILVPGANFFFWPVLLATPGWKEWDAAGSEGPVFRGVMQAVPTSGPAAAALSTLAACGLGWFAAALGAAHPSSAWLLVLLAHFFSGLIGPVLIGLHRSRPFLDCFALGFWLSIAVMVSVLGLGPELPIEAVAMATSGIVLGWAGASMGYGLQLRPRQHAWLDANALPPPRFEA